MNTKCRSSLRLIIVGCANKAIFLVVCALGLALGKRRPASFHHFRRSRGRHRSVPRNGLLFLRLL